MIAREWLHRVSMMFADMGISDDVRMMIVSRLLEGGALTWLDNVRARRVAPLSWAEFETEFLDKFYSAHHRDMKRSEFFNLRQGSRTVEQYETELRELAKYVPEFPEHSEVMRFRFESGLSIAIRDRMGSTPGEDYSTLVQKALRAEELVRARGTFLEKKKGQMSSSSTHGRHKRFRPYEFRGQSHGGGGQYRQPQTTGRPPVPVGQSRPGFGRARPDATCYRCGVRGHISTHCTQERSQASVQGPAGRGGRPFRGPVQSAQGSASRPDRPSQ